MLRKKILLLVIAALAFHSLRAQIITSSGAGGAYTIPNYPGNFTGYYDGFSVIFRSNHANAGGGGTMNIAGLGAINIQTTSGAALAANDIISGQIVTLVYDATAVRFQMITTSGNAGGGGGITGGGTASHIPRWATASTLGNSVMWDDGTNIGIGNTSPQAKLHVQKNVSNGTPMMWVENTVGTGEANLQFKTSGGALDYLEIYKGGPTASGSIDGINLANLSSISTGVNAGPLMLRTVTANPIYFLSNNLTRMTLDASGNLGIGTTAPQSKLDVAGQMYSRSFNANASSNIDWNNGNIQRTSTATSSINFTNLQDGTVCGLFITNGASTTYTFSQAGLTFIFTPPNAATTPGQTTLYKFIRIGSNVYVDWETIGASAGGGGVTGGGTASYIPRWATASTLGNSVMWDDGSRIGVGTTGPLAKLHVSGGSGNYNANLLRLEGDYSSFGHYQQLNFTRTSDGAAIADIRSIFTNAGEWSLDFYGYSAGSLNNVMRMQGNGRVGIGTTGPDAILELSDNGPNWTTWNYRKALRINNASAVEFGGGGSTKFGITGDGADLKFFHTGVEDNSAAHTVDMIIKGGGNVGVGTTNPGERFEVVNTSAQAMIAVDGTGNPGYKFKLSGTEKGALYYNNAQGGLYYYSNTLLDAPFVVMDNGRVGIGTINPGNGKLDVEQSSALPTGYFSNGTGDAISANQSASSGLASAVYATSNSSGGYGVFAQSANGGTAIKGYTAGGGKAGDFEINNTSSTADVVGILTNGTNAKALRVSNTGTGATNTAGYFSATGATTGNYAIVVPSGGGNVGIGTTAPSVSLHINATDAAILPVGNSGNRPATPATGMLRYNTVISGYEYYNGIWTSIAPAPWLTSGSDIYYSSGNVGIGFSGPTEVLHVRKDQNAKTRARVQNATAGTSSAVEFSAMRADNSVMSTGIGDPTFTTADFQGAYVWTDATQGMLLRTEASNANIRLTTNQGGVVTEAVRILGSNGNVGIGTTAPVSKLDVNGVGSPGRIFLHTTNSGLLISDGAELSIWPTNEMYLWNYENAGMHLATNGISRIDILANGNVGIGTNAISANALLAIKDGHVQSQQSGGTPTTVVAGAAIGTLAVTNPTLLNATDVAGMVQFKPGTDAIAGVMAQINFAKSYATPPIVVITGANNIGGQGTGGHYLYVTIVGAGPYTGFQISFQDDPNNVPDLNSALNKYYYHVIETQ